MNIQISEKDQKAYLELLVKGDKKGCSQIVEYYLKNDIDIFLLYTDLFQHSLYIVGELWESGEISVATEHLATSTTEYLLNLVYPKLFLHEKKGRKIIISCIENEFHQIGAKIVADISELVGWDSYFLGANTPGCDLIKMIHDIHPDVVGLSLSINSHIDTLIGLIRLINQECGDLKIIVGGQGFRWGGVDLIHDLKNTEYVGSVFALREYLLGN